jgi:hypothetical protein
LNKIAYSLEEILWDVPFKNLIRINNKLKLSIKPDRVAIIWNHPFLRVESVQIFYSLLFLPPCIPLYSPKGYNWNNKHISQAIHKIFSKLNFELIKLKSQIHSNNYHTKTKLLQNIWIENQNWKTHILGLNPRFAIWIEF